MLGEKIDTVGLAGAAAGGRDAADDRARGVDRRRVLGLALRVVLTLANANGARTAVRTIPEVATALAEIFGTAAENGEQDENGHPWLNE